MRSTFAKFLFLFSTLFATVIPTVHAGLPKNGPHIHYFDGFSGKDILRLDDGSEWRAASPTEAYNTFAWERGNRVFITPNYGIFSNAERYPFYLVNKDRGDSYVRVSPVASSIAFDARSHWVLSANLGLGIATVESGQKTLTSWDIAPNYTHLLRSWKTNDIIIIGVNDVWCSWLNPYDYILINFTRGHFVQASLH
jgi:hypothetical protein